MTADQLQRACDLRSDMAQIADHINQLNKFEKNSFNQWRYLIEAAMNYGIVDAEELAEKVKVVLKGKYESLGSEFDSL